MAKPEQAFDLFDEYNRKAPDRVSWRGREYPSEYFYAIKLYEWVKKLDPEAPEPLLLASRCQHIGRWEIARNTYPEGRAGYLRWRKDLSAFHARKASGILGSLDYDQGTISRVCDIILKKRLRTDPDVQTMEDALCLVFLEFQYDDLIEKQPDEKMVTILRKAWAKMSDPGREAALSLEYSPKGKILLDSALKPADR